MGNRLDGMMQRTQVFSGFAEQGHRIGSHHIDPMRNSTLIYIGTRSVDTNDERYNFFIDTYNGSNTFTIFNDRGLKIRGDIHTELFNNLTNMFEQELLNSYNASIRQY